LIDDLTQLQTQLEGLHPQAILQWGVQNFADRLVIVTSFQPTGIVILDMLREMGIALPVVTLDTAQLFPETSHLIDQCERYFDLQLTRLQPMTDEPLWKSHPDLCCNLRKVVPLGEALNGYESWIAGLRRDQSPQRTTIQIISHDLRYGKIKLSPLALWTEEMVWTYIRAHNLPYNELHDYGFASIGCLPCTRPGDQRSGRWSGQGKNECGIHLSA
jgi:phosphoadenosine phosphosulfate reductase